MRPRGRAKLREKWHTNGNVCLQQLYSTAPPSPGSTNNRPAWLNPDTDKLGMHGLPPKVLYVYELNQSNDGHDFGRLTTKGTKDTK